jgi:tRNA pseudouridine55 synthase
LNYQWPILQILVRCGRGTYIRSIARELGDKLGTGGYLTALRRTQVGPFGLDRAIKPNDLTKENILRHIISPHELK